MAHIHSVYDTDKHFFIDPDTRAVTKEKDKIVVVQGDHNSERFTFELPRFGADGHDMSTCNRVEVHYNNVDAANPSEPHPNAYEVDDLGLSPDDENVVILSWLLSSAATQYVGKLHFSIKFMCDDGDGKPDYVWKTATNKSVFVVEAEDSGEVINTECEDMLKAIEDRITANVTADVDDKVNTAVDEAVEVERKRIDELVAMRTDGGAGKYTFEDDLHDATAVITTNGAVAKLLLDVRGVMLANGERYAFRAIPQAFAPMETVQVSEHTFGDNIVVNIISEPYEGVVLITFLNRGEETTINGDCELEYPLATVSVSEVIDGRVGYDADGNEKTYDNLGEAVRAAQEMAADTADLANGFDGDIATLYREIEELKKNGTGSGGVLVVTFEGDSRDTASHTSSDIYSHIANGGTAVFFDGNHYSNLTMCDPNEAVFCQVWDDNTIYRLVVDGNAGFEEQEIYIPHSGGGGGITVTDDGNGNVTIAASAGVSITDDGNGNVTIV